MTVNDAKNISFEELVAGGDFECECGRVHSGGVSRVIIEDNAIARLPELIAECGAVKPFILSGHDTFAAAGEKVISALKGADIEYSSYVFPRSPVKPDEEAVGSAVMHYDLSCDLIIAVGSGVMNDTGKILASMTGLRYIIVATAPSMDGFSSATSSMERDGLKETIDSTFAWAIVADLDIVAAAPMHMLRAGVGDMLAKYVSIAEWKMGAMLVDEYYCPVVAELVNRSLDKVVNAVPGIVKRDKGAIKSLMEGMVIAGMAMTYAGLSRPASGVEHYFSHILDMRSLAFSDAKADLHGIQVGIGTVYALKTCEYLQTVTPDREKAEAFVSGFSLDDYNNALREFVGPGAEAMIEKENRDGKYNKATHPARLERIITHWDELTDIFRALPPHEQVLDILKELGAPVSYDYLGYDAGQLKKVFIVTKDIRDKYVVTRLLWDLGLLDEAKDAVI